MHPRSTVLSRGWGRAADWGSELFQLQVETMGQEGPQQSLTEEASLSKTVFGSTPPPPPTRPPHHTPQAAPEPTLCYRLETPEPHPPQPHFPSPPWPGNLPHHTHPHPEPESGLSGVYTVTQLMGSYSSLGKGATKLRSWELCVFLWVLNFLNDAESQATGAQVQRAGGQR